MPITVTLDIELGHNSVGGSTGDVGAVGSGDYATIRIPNRAIIAACRSIGTAAPILYDILVYPSSANSVPYHFSNFDFEVVGKVTTAVTFRLTNDGAGDGYYRVKAARPLSTVR